MGLFYTSYKIFHFKDKLDSLPESTDEILPPLHIRMKPTNVCGHNCWYCAYRVDNLQLGQDMVEKDFIPKDKMMEIVDDIIEMGVKGVTFTGGGDPFYYKYLLETVQKLAPSPVKFAALTNGSRLKGEVAEIFAHHATWIRISIDGWDDKSYAEYRGIKEGEYTKVLENMENFKKMNGKCYLGISFIIDQKNYKHIYDTIKRYKDLGVDSVKVSPCVVSNSGKENNEYHRVIYDQVREEVDRSLADLRGVGFEIFDAYHELDEKFEKAHTWCPYIQVLPVIGADQKVYSCQDKAYNLQDGLIGSIENVRFKDFWFSDKKKFFKVNPNKVCNHHCCVNSRNKIILEYLDADPEHLGFV